MPYGSSGANLTFTETLVTIGGGGTASLPVTANAIGGSYQVTADAAGNNGARAAYDLTNLPLMYHISIPFVAGE